MTVSHVVFVILSITALAGALGVVLNRKRYFIPEFIYRRL